LVDDLSWRSVSLRAELDESYQQMVVTYEDDSGTTAQVSLRDNLPIWDDLAEVYREMWNRFFSAGEPWTSSVFSLQADGKVNLKFDYPDKKSAQS
jgi:hypothetical protein